MEYHNQLIKLGHTNDIHEHYVAMGSGDRQDLVTRREQEHAQLKIDHDYIRWHYNEIIKSDAVLVLNFDKNGIKNYIGGNTLMELGFAHVNNKKIFLLNPIPDMMYTDEIKAVQPMVINHDLSLVK